MIEQTKCQWTEDGDGGPWATQCGNYFQVTEGTPDENGFKFCCYCSRGLVQVPYEEELEK